MAYIHVQKQTTPLYLYTKLIKFDYNDTRIFWCIYMELKKECIVANKTRELGI